MEKLLKLESVIYRPDIGEMLDQVSFDLEIGEKAVFFGPENSGINILVPVILGFYQINEGDIFYKGSSVKNMDYIEKHNFRRAVGYVHADFGLMSNMSVDKNISLPLEYHSELNENEIKNKVDEIIDALNLDHCKKLRPIDLTRSEILRTAYARAIAMDPGLLFLEHIFESQSPLNIQTLNADLKKWASMPDKSVIFVTYEPEKFVDLAHKFYMFFNGRIVFSGGREEFLNSDNEFLVQYRLMSDAGPMIIL